MLKPLNGKAYGSIPHLPGSRTGPQDYTIHPGQARILTEKARPAQDVIVVQQKLDGSCVAVAKLDDGSIVPLTRAGWPALTSPYEMHKRFDRWVMERRRLFARLLRPGERVVGEWLAQAHGTRYALPHGPFVAFDLMRGTRRAPYLEVHGRCSAEGLPTPQLVSYGPPCSVEEALRRLEREAHGALDEVEGAVWRCESRERVEFLAKYVRQEKVDGCYLPSETGGEPVWNEVLWEDAPEELSYEAQRAEIYGRLFVALANERPPAMVQWSVRQGLASGEWDDAGIDLDVVCDVVTEWGIQRAVVLAWAAEANWERGEA